MCEMSTCKFDFLHFFVLHIFRCFVAYSPLPIMHPRVPPLPLPAGPNKDLQRRPCVRWFRFGHPEQLCPQGAAGGQEQVSVTRVARPGTPRLPAPPPPCVLLLQKAKVEEAGRARDLPSPAASTSDRLGRPPFGFRGPSYLPPLAHTTGCQKQSNFQSRQSHLQPRTRRVAPDRGVFVGLG